MKVYLGLEQIDGKTDLGFMGRYDPPRTVFHLRLEGDETVTAALSQQDLYHLRSLIDAALPCDKQPVYETLG